eukprot:TRINITY_DN1214_c0_g4_i2.p2 TRINITY_DN1214_c0_g4~~TRINITY_DN1214_c0_g4_i2.p2  ORF type:complete len:132 (+),score=21.68 TRINITY_DN1214_c0_g4_i2:732-1127(+)
MKVGSLTPGPASYNTISYEGISFGLNKKASWTKAKRNDSFTPLTKNPGPGTYELNRAIKPITGISLSRDVRMGRLERASPGPADYSLDHGRCKVQSPKAVFSKAKRDTCRTLLTNAVESSLWTALQKAGLY